MKCQRHGDRERRSRMQVRLSYYPQLKVDHFSDVWLACLQSYLQACYDHSGSGHTVDAYVCELAVAFTSGKTPDTLSRAESEIRRFLSVIDRSTPMGARDFCCFLLFLTSARRRAELQVGVGRSGRSRN